MNENEGKHLNNYRIRMNTYIKINFQINSKINWTYWLQQKGINNHRASIPEDQQQQGNCGEESDDSCCTPFTLIVLRDLLI